MTTFKLLAHALRRWEDGPGVCVCVCVWGGGTERARQREVSRERDRSGRVREAHWKQRPLHVASHIAKIYLHTHTHTHAHTHTHTHARTHYVYIMYKYTHTHTDTHTHTRAHAHTHKHKHAHTFKHARAHTHVLSAPEATKGYTKARRHPRHQAAAAANGVLRGLVSSSSSAAVELAHVDHQQAHVRELEACSARGGVLGVLGVLGGRAGRGCTQVLQSECPSIFAI
jgi:hypothetical protein